MHYHIRLTHNGQRFRCDVCGAEEAVQISIPLSRLEAQSAAFLAAHRNCPARLAIHTSND